MTYKLALVERYIEYRGDMGTIERVSGAFLIIIGVLLVTNTFATLNIFFNRLVPEWLIQYI